MAEQCLASPAHIGLLVAGRSWVPPTNGVVLSLRALERKTTARRRLESLHSGVSGSTPLIY
jgi:hypothetical protein